MKSNIITKYIYWDKALTRILKFKNEESMGKNTGITTLELSIDILMIIAKKR